MKFTRQQSKSVCFSALSLLIQFMLSSCNSGEHLQSQEQLARQSGSNTGLESLLQALSRQIPSQQSLPPTSPEQGKASLIIVNQFWPSFAGGCTVTLRGIKEISLTVANLNFESSFEIVTEGENNIGMNADFRSLNLTCYPNQPKDSKNYYQLSLTREDFFTVDSQFTFYPGANANSRIIIEGICDADENLCLNYSSKHLVSTEAAWYVSSSDKIFKHFGPPQQNLDLQTK